MNARSADAPAYSSAVPTAVVTELRRTTRAFALVDAARDRAVHAFLARLPRQICQSLFEERENPGLLESYSPHLVAVNDETMSGLCSLRGQCCVVFVFAPQDFIDLRRHFRRFLLVRAEGRTLYFRFYDPRILSTFLFNAELDELATFFGAIEKFVLETDDGDNGHLFARDHQGRLTHEILGSGKSPVGRVGY